MKLIIAGTRTLTISFEELEELIHKHFEGEIVTEVVCGGATGMDTVGEQWARKRGIPVTYFYPDWKGLGKAAGPIRNHQMGDYADKALVVHTKSPGSKDMIEYMKKIGKYVGDEPK